MRTSMRIVSYMQKNKPTHINNEKFENRLCRPKHVFQEYASIDADFLIKKHNSDDGLDVRIQRNACTLQK